MKKKVGYEILIGIILSITALTGWSIWYGNNHPQTGWQHLLFLVQINQPRPDTESKIVFLGDSITARGDWNALLGVTSVKNAGISGNTTNDVIARLEAAISSKPQKLFLMIGTNDFLQGKDVAYVMGNYGIILDKIKAGSPDTEIYVQSMLPINNDISKIGTIDSRKIIALNEQLRLLARKNKAIFIDLYPFFCGYDNKLYEGYAGDGVHPNYYGYAVWKTLLLPYVQ